MPFKTKCLLGPHCHSQVLYLSLLAGTTLRMYNIQYGTDFSVCIGEGGPGDHQRSLPIPMIM